MPPNAAPRERTIQALLSLEGVRSTQKPQVTMLMSSSRRRAWFECEAKKDGDCTMNQCIQKKREGCCSLNRDTNTLLERNTQKCCTQNGWCILNDQIMRLCISMYAHPRIPYLLVGLGEPERIGLRQRQVHCHNHFTGLQVHLSYVRTCRRKEEGKRNETEFHDVERQQLYKGETLKKKEGKLRNSKIRQKRKD